MILTANGIAVSTMTLLIPWTGVWSAELQLDGEALPPTGPVAILGDGIALQGSVDPDRSGAFGEQLSLAVVGGMGGWSHPVRPKHYHSDVAVPLATVLATTAAEVKEPPPVCGPETVGKDYVRVAGPASQVLEGRSWYVGLDGITVVGPRPPLPAVDIEILEWNVALGVVVASCDSIVQPGTVLVSPLFGTRTVRDVELVMSADSIRATLWTVAEAPEGASRLELAGLLAGIARAAVRPEYLRLYECRVIGMTGERVDLQPTERLGGSPEIIPASVWSGVPGCKAMLSPGSLVLLGFRSGDPTQPYVAAFEDPEGPGWAPLELTLDARVVLNLGDLVQLVRLAGGSLPVARMGDTVQAGPFSGVITKGNPKVLA